MLRVYAIALAAVLLAGCVNSGYPGGYYQDEAYYDGPYYDGPYYGGGIGYGSYYDDDYDRYYHPSRNVSCDRVRHICYDRYGPSYFATARYLGDREANRAYKKYGDSVFLFSPRPGVSCDRRTRECSDGHWTDRAAPDRLRRLEPGNPGSVGSAPRFDDDDPVWRAKPTRRNSDNAVTRRISPPVEESAPRIVNNDDDHDVGRRKPRILSNEIDRPVQRQRLNSGDKVRDGGGGGDVCPPRGCTD